jgi:hypothetical protein
MTLPEGGVPKTGVFETGLYLAGNAHPDLFTGQLPGLFNLLQI